MRPRPFVLPTMVALLAAYVVMHSPLRNLATAAIGVHSRQCYLGCPGPGSAGRVAEALAALALVSLAALAAHRVSRGLELRSHERPVAFGLLAYALVTVPGAILGGLGSVADSAPLRPPAGPLFVAIPAVLLLLLPARATPPTAASRPACPIIGLPLVVGLVGGLLLLISAIAALTHPPTGYDALAYHAPLGVHLWRDGNLAAYLEGGRAGPAQASPASAELWFGLLRLAGGERLANLGQLPFAVLGAWAVRTFARRSGLRDGAAWLGAAGFLCAPIVVVQAGMQLNDLAGGALLMAAVALAAAPAREWSRTRLAITGLALGLAAATKLSMLPGIAVVGVLAAVYAWRASSSERLRRLALLALAFGIAVAPWWVRNAELFGNPIYPAALPVIGRGFVTADYGSKDNRFVPSRAAWPVYPLIEPHNEQSGSGALFLVAALPGLVLAAGRRRRRAVTLYLAVTATSLVAWWILTQHEPRFLLPLFGLALGFVGWSLAAVPRRRRGPAALVLVAAVVFSAVVTLDQSLAPLALRPPDRTTFYDRVWNIDPLVAELPERDGLLYQMGYAPLSYAGDYALLGPTGGRMMLPVDRDVGRDSLLVLMRGAGIVLAYVPASADETARVEATYAAPAFELVRVSPSPVPAIKGGKRYLFRLRDPGGTR
jgi:hypothetical protein